jgi:CRP-like cAMP-binding protein
MPKPSSKPPHQTGNQLLNALPPKDFERLSINFEEIDLPLGKYLFRANEPIEYLYFPNNAMGSIVALTSEGQSVEVGVVGFEGVVGIDVLMGVDSTVNESMIQIPGSGLRITAAAARQEFERGGNFQKIMMRYIHSFMSQISQTALCNRLHSTEQRLSRWLLMCHDRTNGNELQLTQEFLGIMLGAHRPSITTSALVLQSSGFIKYRRGWITILDREGLEDFTCDCYQIVKQDDENLPE